MLGITDLTTYVIGTILIILLPGPNSLYVLSVAARRGVRAGYAGAGGVVVGDTVLMILAAAGVGSLLKTHPAVFMVLKYAGGAYLAWVGVQLVRSAIERWRQRLDIASAPVTTDFPQHAGKPFKRALMISLVNPKAILFFVSFFIQFVDPAYAYPALTFVALGAIVQFFSIIYLSVLILAGARIAEAFCRCNRLASGMTGGVGVLFIGFGARLATATVD